MNFSITLKFHSDEKCAFCQENNNAQLIIQLNDYDSNYSESISNITFCISHIFDFSAFELLQNSALGKYQPLISDILTTLQMSKNMELESAKNMEFLNLAHSVNSLIRKKTNIPVVIIAPGPSLSEAIEFLKKNKDVIFSIALNSAFDACLDYGYKPDAVFCIESSPAIASQFKQYSYDNTILFFDPAMENSTIKKFSGIKFPVFDFENNLQNLFAYVIDASHENWKHRAGYSVLTSAIALALEITTNNIYLVGTDLCFTKGFTHDPKSAISLPIIDNDELPYKIICYDEIIRETFLAYKLTAELISTIFQNEKDKIFSTSKTAAKLTNIKCINLADHAKLFDEVSLRSKSNFYTQINYTDRSIKYNDKIILKTNEFRNQIIIDIEKINDLTLDKILPIIDEAKKTNDNEIINQLVSSLNKTHIDIFVKSKWSQIYNSLNNQLNLVYGINSSLTNLQNLPQHTIAMRLSTYLTISLKNLIQLKDIVESVILKIKNGSI